MFSPFSLSLLHLSFKNQTFTPKNYKSKAKYNQRKCSTIHNRRLAVLKSQVNFLQLRRSLQRFRVAIIHSMLRLFRSKRLLMNGKRLKHTFKIPMALRTVLIRSLLMSFSKSEGLIEQISSCSFLIFLFQLIFFKHLILSF